MNVYLGQWAPLVYLCNWWRDHGGVSIRFYGCTIGRHWFIGAFRVTDADERVDA